MTDAEISERLQQALADWNLQLRAKRQGSDLWIAIRRPTPEGLDYPKLLQRLAEALRQLPEPTRRAMIQCRAPGQEQADWKTQLDLQAPVALPADRAPRGGIRLKPGGSRREFVAVLALSIGIQVVAVATGWWWLVRRVVEEWNFGWPHWLLVVFLTTVTIALLVGGAPLLLDWTLVRWHGLRWGDLRELKSVSPEAVQRIEQVGLQPRLGILASPTPWIWSYGDPITPPRLLISRAALRSLPEAELASLVARELGHATRRDLAVLTPLVGLLLLLLQAREQLLRRFNGSGMLAEAMRKLGGGIGLLATLLSLPLLYLARLRHAQADHFACQATGNPNGLVRALIQVAAAMQGSALLQATRLLGPLDPNLALLVVAAKQDGRVLSWDLTNPAAIWLEFYTSHPFIGRRLLALQRYADQLRLRPQFNAAALRQRGSRLQPVLVEALLYHAPLLGALLGLGFGNSTWAKLGAVLFGSCVGLLLRTGFLFPKMPADPDRVSISAALQDAAAGPLRGRPLRLEGEMQSKQAQLLLQDGTGQIRLRYTPRLGPLTYGLFASSPVGRWVGRKVTAVGWLRREADPVFDLLWIRASNGTELPSYHYFSASIVGLLGGLVGLVLLFR